MRSLFQSSARFMRVVVVITVIMTASTIGTAQSFQGSVRGTVRDAEGVIPGADVTLTNRSSGAVRQTVTNSVGEYSFPAVDPAPYTLRVEVSGFRPYTNPNILVATQAHIDIPVTLSIAALEENVTVTAAVPLIETSSASQSSTLTVQNFRELPSEGRSVFLMATLEPTVVASGNAHYNRMQDQSGNSSLSMGGGAVRSNNFLIDGFPTTDMQNRSSVNPSMEALEDARVQIHTYDTEMGRTGGGVMNMTARAGGNRFQGSGYTVFRPEALQSQLLIPRLTQEAFRPEYWRNGGGGFGGPIVPNRTFFWFAGEKYLDNQPQAGAITVPSMASRLGDFSQVTRNGKPVTIVDPLTGQPFPGNIIPADRLNSTGATIASYMPAPNRDADDGTQNLSQTAILPSHAYQWTTKINHNFSNAVSMSAFYLRQVTGENSANWNREHPEAGTQFYLERADHTIVVNNTWVMTPTTVLTLRGGWNQFQDGNKLPVPFDATALWPGNGAYTSAFADSRRFPTTSITGYGGTGWSNRSDNVYYQYGFNGTLSKLANVHSLKAGGDYRTIGVRSSTFGASTGSFSFDGRFTGNALADLLLGYPSSGNIPISADLDGYIRYTAAYFQDDWRVSNRLTVNYGVRLEHETNLQERQNRIATDFAMTTVNPLNDLVNLVDPVTGQPRTIYGGLVYAGENGAPNQLGGTRKPQVSPRAGAVYKFNDKTVVRGGWGIYVAPWNYGSAGTSNWSQYGYSSTTDLQQSSGGVPITSLSDPFPDGLVQPTGPSLGLLTNAGANTNVVLPMKGTPKVQQVLGRSAAPVSRRCDAGRRLHGPVRQRSVVVDRPRSQRARPELSDFPRRHARQCGQSLLRHPRGGAVRRPQHDPARPAPAPVSGIRQHHVERRHRRALAVPRVHRAGPQARRQRLGRELQLHLQPAERQPGRPGQLLLERVTRAERVRAGALLAVLQPGFGVRAESARLAAQAHGVAHAPAALRRRQALPVGQRLGRRRARRLVDDRRAAAAERIPDRRQPEHHRRTVPVRRRDPA